MNTLPCSLTNTRATTAIMAARYERPISLTASSPRGSPSSRRCSTRRSARSSPAPTASAGRRTPTGSGAWSTTAPPGPRCVDALDAPRRVRSANRVERRERQRRHRRRDQRRARASPTGEFVALLDHDDALVADRAGQAVDLDGPTGATSTTSTPTRPTCSPTAASRRTSSSRTGRRSDSARRCTRATCRCCAVGRRRDRRVPRRLRRLAGPRPDPAGHGADHRRRSASPPPARARLPLAQHLELGVAGR